MCVARMSRSFVVRSVGDMSSVGSLQAYVKSSGYGELHNACVSRIHCVKCPDCEICTTTVPWFSACTRVMYEFEAMGIDLWQETKTISAVAR